jgi:DNA polymerase-1
MILLFDGNNIAYRCYFSGELSTASGIKTSIPYKGIRDILKIADEVQPDYTLIVFDGGRSPKRSEIYPEYKAKREEQRSSKFDKQDFYDQIHLFEKGLDLFGFPRVRIKGIETDDIIAQIVKKITKEEICIASTDKDFLQLLSPKVSMINPITKKRYDMNNFEKETGYKKPQDYLKGKLFIGDPADNISGVPGVGEKTALKLISVNKSISGITALPDMVKKNAAFIIRRNLALMDLSLNPDNVKFEDVVGAIKQEEQDVEGLVKYFEELEFKTVNIMEFNNKIGTNNIKLLLEEAL